MTFKVTPKLLEAFVNLRGNRDFAAVLEGMKEHMSSEVRRCVDGEGAVQLRASGAVKTLDAWLTAYETAPESLDKLRNQGQKTP